MQVRRKVQGQVREPVRDQIKEILNETARL
jgi:hypothetical protein